MAAVTLAAVTLAAVVETKQLKPLLLTIALLFSTPAWADDDDLARDELLKDADYFAECSGVFTITSSLNESDSPASAKLEEQKAIEAAEYEHKFTKLEDQLEELKVAMLAGSKEFASLAK